MYLIFTVEQTTVLYIKRNLTIRPSVSVGRSGAYCSVSSMRPSVSVGGSGA